MIPNWRTAHAAEWVAFDMECLCGDLAEVEKLAAKNGFATPEALRSENCSALERACEEGHVEIIAWLARVANFGPEDADQALPALRLAMKKRRWRAAALLKKSLGTQGRCSVHCTKRAQDIPHEGRNSRPSHQSLGKPAVLHC